MAVVGGRLGYWMLRKIAPQESYSGQGNHPPDGDTKLQEFFGDGFFETIRGKTVLDFGCGDGGQSVEMAEKGAGKVIGVDIQEPRLARGRKLAQARKVADRCFFGTTSPEPVDVIISKDAFEHFADPAAILRLMSGLLKPGGFVLASFGPTWLHPYGGHLFSVFPWAHFFFSEKALIRWRSDFKTDGAKRFAEVDGGLNKLTISGFEALVAQSPFRFEYLETVPIRRMSLLKHKALRELGSSFVRCKLTLKDPPHARP
jgi:SAM-dependent methyltransferase